MKRRIYYFICRSCSRRLPEVTWWNICKRLCDDCYTPEVQA